MISCLNPITIYDYSRVRNFKKSLNDSIISEKKRYRRFVNSEDLYNKESLTVGCGKCKLCLQKKANERALRIQHELEYYTYDKLSKEEQEELKYKVYDNFNRCFVSVHHLYKACFVTLTYRDDSISENYSICKNDVILFKKRLRKAIYTDIRKNLCEKAIECDKYRSIYQNKKRREEYIKAEYKKNKLMFAETAEYGENYHRPHYHLLILNYAYTLKNARRVADCWKKGKVQVEALQDSNKASGYVNKVIQYATKSQKDYMYDKEVYRARTNREAVYTQLSRGFGKRYAVEHAKELYQYLGFNRSFTMNRSGLTVRYLQPLPRQYALWIQNIFEEYSDIFRKRRDMYKEQYNKEIEDISYKNKLNFEKELKDLKTDDFYNIQNHKEIYNYVIDLNHHRLKMFEEEKDFFKFDIQNSGKRRLANHSLSRDSLKFYTNSHNLKELKPNEKLENIDDRKQIYTCYWGNKSFNSVKKKDYDFKRSVSIDYTNRMRTHQILKTRYSDYINYDSFPELQAS